MCIFHKISLLLFKQLGQGPKFNNQIQIVTYSEILRSLEN